MNDTSADQPTEKEIMQAGEILAKLEPGYLPEPIFLQVARMCAVPVVEIVPLRRNGDDIEVLLLERDNDDPYFANGLHTPGTVLRATDSEQSAIDRVLHGELQGVATSDPTYLMYFINHSRRGTESARIFWVEVLGEPTEGMFYSCDALPERLVESQPGFIEAARKAFQATLS